MAFSSFNLEKLRAGIRPFGLHWFPRLRSTNDHAAALRRRRKLFAPAIVLSGQQTAGRGRTGAWWSGQGALTVTFVLPSEEHLVPQQLPLVAGLAVRNAAAELSGEKNIQLKWPNDILYRDKKLAGLLCERVDKADLIGIGLNVNVNSKRAPQALRPRLASLAEIAGTSIDITTALIALTSHLKRTLACWHERPFAALLQEYDQHHALRGRRVTILDGTQIPLTGTCEGLDHQGRLRLRVRDRVHALITGHVEMT